MIGPRRLAPGEALEVVAGTVRVFAVRAPHRLPVATVPAGGLLLGPPPDVALELVAVGLDDEADVADVAPDAAAPHVDAWLAAVDAVAGRLDALDGDDAERLARRRAHDAELDRVAYTGLGSVLGDRVQPLDGDVGNRVVDALRLVGAAARIPIVAPPRHATDLVVGTAHASGVRSRRVTLGDGWWRDGVPPFLAWRLDGSPVAVVPGRRGYDVVDPADGTRQRVTSEVAAGLAPEGASLYRPLPPGPLRRRDLLAFLWPTTARDLLHVAAFGVAAAGLSLIPPILSRYLFETGVPGLQRGLVVAIALLVVVLGVCGAVLATSQQLVFLRLQGRASSELQAAIWDRVLDLPLPFFRERSAGSLASRVLSVDQIRQLATGTIITALLALPVALANMALLFVLDVRLAAFGVGAIVLVTGTMTVHARRQLPLQRRVRDAANELFGTSMQLVDAVGKLRVANAERRAFARWAREFGALKRSSYDASLARGKVVAISAAAPTFATGLVLLGAAVLPGSHPSGATFLAFDTAFLQALAAFGGLAGVVTFFAEAAPLVENVQPILDEARETRVGTADPGLLAGRVELSHVSHRYGDDGPLALDDVDLVAEPGEFVAIVGPSGAGKSTLLRIMLGFERPTVGSVTLDGHDVEGLDVRAVRRQIGVVVQTAQLLPGSILTNITGSRQLTLDEAWEAAEIAGIAEDIRALPMGMFTFVAEGNGTFSGGQRQRLLIARAVAGAPRILLFDEATSALDNRTQAAVTGAIEQLGATRIVIAHRLSTVRAADRIYVLDKGRIVQHGTYDDLVAVDGPFRRLAHRQLVRTGDAT